MLGKIAIGIVVGGIILGLLPKIFEMIALGINAIRLRWKEREEEEVELFSEEEMRERRKKIAHCLAIGGSVLLVCGPIGWLASLLIWGMAAALHPKKKQPPPDAP
ncbi:MAG: hypothetical protein OXF02_07855 [Simkaniaceae bacterium]|nr:hypothetical protein [Simkaniaceae bacterium]